MNNASLCSPARLTLTGLLAFWPIYLVAMSAVYAFGGPLWNAARVAWAGGAHGGVEVDTRGATGKSVGGRYVLDLPVEIINGTENMVLGVSLWVESYACPDETTRLAGCRRLTAFEQDMPLRLAPGSMASHSQQMTGIAPRPGEVIRIERKLQSVDDSSAPAAP